MPLRDLREAGSWIERIHKRVRRLESGAWLENSSITDGLMRFIRGILRIEQGGRLELIGTLDGVGTFIWRGPWTFTGDGEITGDVDLTGNLEVLDDGRIKVGNVILSPEGNGRITVGTGTQQIVIDAATPRITIGGGAAQIILDPTQFRVGPAFKMDPAHSSTGAQQAFGVTGKSTIFGDDQSLQLQLGNVLAAVRLLSNVGPLGTGPGVQLEGQTRLDALDPLPAGEGYKIVVRSDVTGLLHSYSGGTGGGPGDGIFAYPFPLDQVTSEFRPPDRPAHDGMDFGIGPSNTQGTPIPSAGSGVVETVGSPSSAHGWGYYVLVNHGTDPNYGNATIQTRYAHMFQSPAVSVGDPVMLGQTLGGIGNTGNSFGNHLHWEVLANGIPINPRTFMAAHGA